MPQSPADIEAVALLNDAVRRELYEWIGAVGRPVGRDEAAERVGVARSLAAFHLDRLAAEGLLEVQYRRLTGRTGPGAGRPAKLYQRSQREVTVTLPDRHYDVPAQLFASAIEQITHGVPPSPLLSAARRLGESLGKVARQHAGTRPNLHRLHAALIAALNERGYEPRETGTGEIRFGNCPFHALVEEHRDLVCGSNLAVAQGILAGLGDTGATARLDPQPGLCCVAIAPGGRPRRAHPD